MRFFYCKKLSFECSIKLKAKNVILYMKSSALEPNNNQLNCSKSKMEYFFSSICCECGEKRCNKLHLLAKRGKKTLCTYTHWFKWVILNLAMIFDAEMNKKNIFFAQIT